MPADPVLVFYNNSWSSEIQTNPSSYIHWHRQLHVMLPICALQKSHKQGQCDSDVKGSSFETLEKHPVLQANQHLRLCEVAPSFANNFFCSASDISTGFSWRSYVIQASCNKIWRMTIITSRLILDPKKLRRGRGYIHEYNTLQPSGFDGLNLSVKRCVVYIEFTSMMKHCFKGWGLLSWEFFFTSPTPILWRYGHLAHLDPAKWRSVSVAQLRLTRRARHGLSPFMICILLFMICNLYVTFIYASKSLGSTACRVSWQFILI